MRGADPQWARKVYGFALKPDLIIYLKADIETLVSRIVHGRGFDYWEAGMDIRKTNNLYDSFCIYQSELIKQFEIMASEYGFINIDASRPIHAVFADVKKVIRTHLQVTNL